MGEAMTDKNEISHIVRNGLQSILAYAENEETPPEMRLKEIKNAVLVIAAELRKVGI